MISSSDILALPDSPQKRVTTVEEKRCPKCGKVKPLSDFWRDAVGYFDRCKVCHVGPRPDLGAKCACGRMAEAKCVCGLNLCESHWWKHSHGDRHRRWSGVR